MVFRPKDSIDLIRNPIEFTQALEGAGLDTKLHEKLFKHSTRRDGSLKPEAKVRIARIIKLISEYGYESRQIDIEVPAGRIGRAAESGSDTVFADIVVYRDFTRKECLFIIETKAPHEKGGIRQAESYARNIGAEYHAWDNGENPARFFRTERFGTESQPIGDIPRWVGTKPVVAEILKSMSLPPFRDENEMREVVHRCHELILEKQGHDPAKAFDELTKLLFLKLYDEREIPSVYKCMVLESVREVYVFKHIFLSMRRIDAKSRKARAVLVRFSKSLASRRHLPSQANVLSTTHRLGMTSKPTAVSDRLTISVSKWGKIFFRAWSNTGPWYPPSAKSFFRNGNLPNKVPRTRTPPSRSWILAGCTMACTNRPTVSTRMWRFLPLIFLPAS